MSATVINLNDYRKSNIRCQQIGLTFPQLYRRRGVSWDVPEGQSLDNHTHLVPGTLPVTFYTFDNTYDETIASSEWDAIAEPDHVFDQGWIIVRHHMNEDRASGYLSGFADMEQDGRELNRVLFRTQSGLFTIIRRAPLKGKPNPLLMFAATVPDPRFGEMDWWKIIGVGGEELTDDVLVSLEEDES